MRNFNCNSNCNHETNYVYDVIGYIGEAEYGTGTGTQVVKRIKEGTRGIVSLARNRKSNTLPFRVGETVDINGDGVKYQIKGYYKDLDGTIIYETDYMEWYYTEESVNSRLKAEDNKEGPKTKEQCNRLRDEGLSANEIKDIFRDSSNNLPEYPISKDQMQLRLQREYNAVWEEKIIKHVEVSVLLYDLEPTPFGTYKGDQLLNKKGKRWIENKRDQIRRKQELELERLKIEYQGKGLHLTD